MSGGERMLICVVHGREAWHGEIVCAPSAGGCGHVWKLQDNADVPPPELGKHCTCGRSLVGADGTGRAICPGHYEEKRRTYS